MTDTKNKKRTRAYGKITLSVDTATIDNILRNRGAKINPQNRRAVMDAMWISANSQLENDITDNFVDCLDNEEIGLKTDYDGEEVE